MLSEKFIRAAIKRRLDEKINFGTSGYKKTAGGKEQTVSGKGEAEDDKPGRATLPTSIYSKTATGATSNAHDVNTFESLCKSLKFAIPKGYTVDDARLRNAVIAKFVGEAQANKKAAEVIFGGSIASLQADVTKYVNKEITTSQFFANATSQVKNNLTTNHKEYKLFQDPIGFAFVKWTTAPTPPPADPKNNFPFLHLKLLVDKKFKFGEATDLPGAVSGLEEGEKGPKFLLLTDEKEFMSAASARYGDVYSKFNGEFKEKFYDPWINWRGTKGQTNKGSTIAMTWLIYKMIEADDSDLSLTKMWSAYAAAEANKAYGFFQTSYGTGSGIDTGLGLSVGGIDLEALKNVFESDQSEALAIYAAGHDHYMRSSFDKDSSPKISYSPRNIWEKRTDLSDGTQFGINTAGIGADFRTDFATKYPGVTLTDFSMFPCWYSLYYYGMACRMLQNEVYDGFFSGITFGGWADALRESDTNQHATFQAKIIKGIITHKYDKSTAMGAFPQAMLDVSEKSCKELHTTTYDKIMQTAEKEDEESGDEALEESRYLVKTIKKLLSEASKDKKGVELNADFYDVFDENGYNFFYFAGGGVIYFDDSQKTSFIGVRPVTFYDFFYFYDGTTKNDNDKMIVDAIVTVKAQAGAGFDFNNLFVIKTSTVMKIQDLLKANKNPPRLNMTTFKPLGLGGTGPFLSKNDEAKFNDYVLELDDAYNALAVAQIFRAISNERNDKYANAVGLFKNIKTNQDKIKIGQSGKTYSDALVTADDVATPEDKAKIAQNKKLITTIYNSISNALPRILGDGGDQQAFNDERDAALDRAAMSLSREGMKKNHPLFQRYFTFFMQKKAGKKVIDRINFISLTNDTAAVLGAAKHSKLGFTGDNVLQRLGKGIANLSRYPDVPVLQQHGKKAAGEEAGVLIRPQDFKDKIFSTIKFAATGQSLTWSAKMTDASAKFVDDIANLIKRKNRALPKELVIEYSFDISGKVQPSTPPKITNLSVGEVNRIFGPNKRNLNTILLDSIKIFNDATTPLVGVLDKGSGITTSAAGTFTITFPVGRYRSSKAEEKRTSGRRRLRESQEKELARLIRKLL